MRPKENRLIQLLSRYNTISTKTLRYASFFFFIKLIKKDTQF